MQIELLLVVVPKALAELAAMFLLGRGLLYILAGQHREKNFIYQILSVITNPIFKATRFITPKVVLDRHIPFVAFLLVAWIWIGVVFWALPEVCGSGRVDCSELLERKRAAD
jgi:hypothetical protein